MGLEDGLRFLENPRVLQMSTTRRGLFGMAATAAAALAVLGDEPSAEAKRSEVEIFRASALRPISIPEIGVASQVLNLDALPPNIQRVVLFYTGLGCHPCEKVEDKMKTAWSSLPNDAVVVPIDKSLSLEHQARLALTVSQATEDCTRLPDPDTEEGEMFGMRLYNFSLERPELKNDTRQLLEAFIRDNCEGIKSAHQREVAWLQGKYELFVRRGNSPGIYQEIGDETVTDPFRGIPQLIVIRRADGRVMRRPVTKSLLDASPARIWNAILGGR